MEFFVLSALAGGPYETWIEPIGQPGLGDAPLCKICGRFVGLRPWTPPFRLKVKWYGNEPGDVGFNAAGSELLLSETFVQEMTKAGVSGLESLSPATRLEFDPSLRAHDSQKYQVFIPALGQTRIDFERTTMMGSIRRHCPLCGGDRSVDAILGLEIDLESWDGLDVFVPWGLSGLTVVTSNFRLAAVRSNIKNLHLVSTAEYRWNPLQGSSDTLGG